MSTLQVNLEQIHISRQELKASLKEIEQVYNKMYGTIKLVSREIKTHSDVMQQVKALEDKIKNVTENLVQLIEFLQYSELKYKEAEEEAIRRVNDVLNNIPSEILKHLRAFRDKFKLYDSSDLDGFLDYFDINSAYITMLRSVSLINEIKNKKLNYRIIKENGKTYVKILTPLTDHNERKQFFKDLIGNDLANKKNKYYKNLINKGVPLYNSQDTNQYARARTIFSNSKIDDLNLYISQLGMKNRDKMKFAGNSEFKGNLNIFDDFKGWGNTSNFGKVAKGTGIFGSIFSFGSNLNTALSEETGTTDVTRRIVTDTAIDISSAAAMMAAGAAIAAPIAPPAGPIVGAAIGFVANVAINYEFGTPPTSIVGNTKKLANKVIDGTVDAVSGAMSNIGKGIGKLIF
jgi:hypothetical protein